MRGKWAGNGVRQGECRLRTRLDRGNVDQERGRTRETRARNGVKQRGTWIGNGVGRGERGPRMGLDRRNGVGRGECGLGMGLDGGGNAGQEWGRTRGTWAENEVERENGVG